MPTAITNFEGYLKIEKSRKKGGVLHVTPDGVPFGVPHFEREGVPDRRVAYTHGWSDRDMIWIRERKHLELVESDGLPADWRESEAVV